MPVLRVDHVNIKASSEVVEACRRFYIDVLGLTDGTRPPFRSRGFWLYADGQPIVHLTESSSDDATAAMPASLDHIAFACAGLQEMLKTLHDRGIIHRVEHVPGTDHVQLFLRDPAGISLELNFRETKLS